MDNESILKRIRAGNFVENNGRILRAINILRYKYIKLNGFGRAFPDLQSDEILDSVNFLTEEGYICLRHVETKAETTLADTHYKQLEAKLTGKGIRLLTGDIKDPAVAV